jgi:hypothetical protein
MPSRGRSGAGNEMAVESRRSAVVYRPGGAQFARRPFERVLAEKAITPFLPPRSSNRT